MEDAHERKSTTFGGMRPSRTYTRFAQRHVERWIEHERTQPSQFRYTSYSIHIEKESRNFFTCQIKIRIDAREWSGIDEGRSVRDAILNALRSLKPHERIELYGPPNTPSPHLHHEISA
jgi:hypothetical protein